MPWDWELRDNDDDNDIGLARFVILAEKSQAVKDFINSPNKVRIFALPLLIQGGLHKIASLLISNYEASQLPASHHDYQQNSQGRYALVKKIYNALCTAGIEYAQSEDDKPHRQNIRTPEEILYTEHKGNCLDLTILFCALCWHYRLLPILIYVKTEGCDHVVAAVSLKGNRDNWQESVQFSEGLGKLTDKQTLQDICKKQGYIAIECTGFGKSKSWNQNSQQNDRLLPFEQAKNRGKQILTEDRCSLKFAIDIALTHSNKYWWRGIIRDSIAQEKKSSSINNPITIRNLLSLDNSSDSPYVNPKVKAQNLGEDACEAEDIFKKIHSQSLERLNQIRNSTTDIGYRLAIIGEPGGGKTMLLLQIAEWVRERKELAIWISLPKVWNFLSRENKLREKNGLHQYLLEVWLRDAVKETTQSLNECKQALKELLDSKKVWLLLDGANEIARSDALNRINDWLIDGLNLTRIVLTCRFNEWVMSKNSLTNSFFNVYSLCGYEEYNEPHSKVHKFIQKWFKGEQSKIEGITQEIRNHAYLQPLAQNPLSLAMLCYIFGIFGKGKMLETKAELYRKFEDAYYQRKEDDITGLPKLNIIQRKTLRQTIGELAVKAFQEENTPLELREQFITNFFENKPELINGLTQFELVCDWGWLNNDNIGGNYKLFHSTFQEYFASQAIDNWDEFLPRQHDNQPLRSEGKKYKHYRIFEARWKEIILFWLGRNPDQAFREEKNEFINALVNFQDKSTNFYGYRAHFLAAEGIAQFRDCNQSREIVKRVVDWSLNRFDENKKQPGETFALPISQAAKDVLASFEREFLQELFPYYQYENQQELEQSNLSNLLSAQERVNRIVNIARELHDNHPVRWQAIEVLGEIGNGNQTAIDFLIEVFDRSQKDGDTYLQLKSALHLAAIGINSNFISAYRVLIRLSALYTQLTGRNDSTGLIDVAKKLKTLGEYQSQTEYKSSFEDLQKLLPGNAGCRKIIILLKEYLSSYRIEIPDGYEEKLPEWQELGIADYLYLDQPQAPSERFRDCYKTLWYCAQVLSYPEFYSAFNAEPSSKE
jgi:hypothetical protein